MDKNWKFCNNDISTAAVIKFDDSSWQTVGVPHDWAISGNFNMNIDAQFVKVIEDGDSISKFRTGRTGALPTFGVGWYRKALPVTIADKAKRVFIEFDGAMSLAKIYLNGAFVGEWPYGYTSFSFDLTDFINFGKENILAVRLENKPESSRWYTGAGLYRNVRLIKTNPTHVKHWGTYITTPEISAKNATVKIRTSITTQPDKGVVKLVTEIQNNAGQKVKSQTDVIKADSSNLTFHQTLNIKNPLLWSTEQPNLYKAISKVYVNNVQVDEYVSVFGCRSLRFDTNTGFYLNGKSLKLKGVCMHHDLGPLGAAVSYRATLRQLQMMKEMGANAIRTTHNPPSPEVLQVCDSLGLLAIVEAFDEWKMGKNQNGYHLYFDDWHERDLQNMIRRDRNHPSVIAWSIGNEIHEQEVPEGKEIAQRLTEICHNEDPSRLTTAGFNNHNAAIKNGLSDAVDLVGFNYKPQDYKSKHQKYPEYKLFGSETASTVSSRGEYKFPVKEIKGVWHKDYQVSSYDLEYPPWATTPDTEFQAQDDNAFIFGEFVWTGFDYLGEPTPYNEGTPAKSSYFGIVDLAGLKKDRFYLYQSKWSDVHVLHVLPHWNWPERTGQKVPVYCYTNYPKVELFVNGESKGVKQKDKSNKYSRYRLMWNDVVYTPGEIKVVAYNDSNKAVAEQVIKTAGESYAVKMNVDRSVIKADGKDLAFVTVEVVDKNGNLCPGADQMLFFEVSGAGRLKALCNGNAVDQTSFSSNYMRVFNGKLVAVIESSGFAGQINLKAFGSNLEQQTISFIAD